MYGLRKEWTGSLMQLNPLFIDIEKNKEKSDAGGNTRSGGHQVKTTPSQTSSS